MPGILVRALRNKGRIYRSVWKVVVKVSEEFREIAEYIEAFAKKEHITTDEALDYVMPKLFKDYKRKEQGEDNVGQ